jgi:hypothetical protein
LATGIAPETLGRLIAVSPSRAVPLGAGAI